MDMAEFAESVKDDKLRKSLNDVLIGGRKQFRRFKDKLSSDADELARYYEFMEKQNHERVMDWLDSIRVKVIISE